MTGPDTTRLDAVLADLGELGFDVTRTHGDPGPGWVRLDAYVGDPATLDDGLRLAGERFQRPGPSAESGGWLVGDVAAAVSWPAVAAMLTEATALVSDGTSVHLPTPRTGRRLSARIDAAVGYLPATPESFAEAVTTTLRPVVEAVHARTRRGHHALWGTVTDMLAAAFHRVGDHLGRPGEARCLASACIESSAVLAGGANWREVAWSGGTERTRVRNICCLWYRTPGGGLCLTCPRLADEDRVRLLEERAGTR